MASENGVTYALKLCLYTFKPYISYVLLLYSTICAQENVVHFISANPPPPKIPHSREASSAKPSRLATSLTFGKDTWRWRALQALLVVLCAHAWYSKTAITTAVQPYLPHFAMFIILYRT